MDRPIPTSSDTDGNDEAEHAAGAEGGASLNEPLLRTSANLGSSMDEETGNSGGGGGLNRHAGRSQSDLRQRQRHRAGDASSRILDRDAAFHQSRGRWSVERLTRGHRQNINFCRRWHQKIWKDWIHGDWFHRLAYMRTLPLLMLFVFVYCVIVVFFAFVYLTSSRLGQQITTNADGTSKVIPFCDMDVNDHLEALYFSLSTMTTIGYGVSNYYYSGCWTPLLLVLWQVCTAILFDAIAVGLIFHRISRGRKRGKTITFSDKAVIRRVRGVPHLMFRLGELRKYSLIEATLRVYCVRHERHPVPKRSFIKPPAGQQLHQQQHGQERSIRQAPEQKDANDVLSSPSSGNSSLPPPPSMEEIDIETTHFITRQVRLTNPDESFGNHILMSLPQVVVHRMDRNSPLLPPQPVWYDADGAAHPGLSDFDNLKAFLQDRLAEIVVLVEGTDEGTGAPVQARHSYTLYDLAWNKTFVSCIAPSMEDVGEDGNDGGWRLPLRQHSTEADNVVQVDFSKFHDIVDTPLDCESCAYVTPSESS